MGGDQGYLSPAFAHEFFEAFLLLLGLRVIGVSRAREQADAEGKPRAPLQFIPQVKSVSAVEEPAIPGLHGHTAVTRRMPWKGHKQDSGREPGEFPHAIHTEPGLG